MDLTLDAKRATELRSLFDEIEPYETGMLPVGDGHHIYYEQNGNPDGKPAVYVHGGPGAGSNSGQRRVFDPSRYRIVLFDQRGCGHSTPLASLEANTTWHLVEDMERLRKHLDIKRWQVCGGSWGSALSLAYAQSYPESVTELVLRGIFTLRKKELNWFYENGDGGAAFVFPDEWDKYIAPIPEAERSNMIDAYYKRLTSDDEQTRLTAARAWSMWEGATINLLQKSEQINNYGAQEFALAFARIEAHYFYHKGFFGSDDWLLQNIDCIRHIPTTIVQGRYDMCTPVLTAWDLHKVFPEADFYVVPDAGHAFDEPGIADRLVRTTDSYAG